MRNRAATGLMGTFLTGGTKEFIADAGSLSGCHPAPWSPGLGGVNHQYVCGIACKWNGGAGFTWGGG